MICKQCRYDAARTAVRPVVVGPILEKEPMAEAHGRDLGLAHVANRCPIWYKNDGEALHSHFSRHLYARMVPAP